MMSQGFEFSQVIYRNNLLTKKAKMLLILQKINLLGKISQHDVVNGRCNLLIKKDSTK